MFTLAVVLVAAAIIYSFFYLENEFWGYPNTEKLVSQTKLLKAGKYDSLNHKELFGKEGFFEILDQDNKMIYKSDPKKSVSEYTLSEVACIPEYFSSRFLYVTEYTKKEEAGRILIEVSSYDEEAQQVEQIGYLILDDKKNVLEDTVPMGKEKFTDTEYQYLQNQDVLHEGYSIYKYSFTDSSGEVFTLVMHQKDLSIETYSMVSSFYRFQIVLFVICYLMLITFFVYWMNRKVKKPLEILNHAIIEVTDGKRDSQITYTGPSEFEKICESFNQMSDKLKESEKRQQSLVEEKQKLLADISHDLKTPITVIQGYAKAINDGIIAESEKEKYLNTIYYKANGLAELIQVFYEYSRLEHPDFSIVKEKRDLCETIREYLACKYEEITMHGFFLEADIPSEPMVLMFDAIQLKRVFENIIGNSMKHNEKGVTIFFFLKQTEKVVELTIGDNGKGIPEGIAETLFEAFVVGDESRNNKQGSGLGLAIARKIIEAHNGTIQLMQKDNIGMSIVITLRRE